MLKGSRGNGEALDLDVEPVRIVRHHVGPMGERTTIIDYFGDDGIAEWREVVRAAEAEAEEEENPFSIELAWSETVQLALCDFEPTEPQWSTP